MKIRSIRAISIVVGLISALVVLAMGLAYGIGVGGIIAGAAGTFVLSFVAAQYGLSKFIIYRIKPIYQIVLSRNIKTRVLESELLQKGNVVRTIEEELSAWAEKNSNEISRLKENEQYRKEFLGNVSHEIKTPIFNIQGYILTLLDGGLEDPAVNRLYLERAEKSIDRLINTVTDLEEISKLESGGMMLKLEKFDIVALAREIVEALEMEAGKRGIRVIVGMDGQPTDPIVVKGDKKYIGYVLINLIINSIKYGNENGTTQISFIDMFDKVMVEVTDDGVGIAAQDTPRIFERFYRTDKSRSREMGGTGLGLAIVKHILEAHGETITLRSELGVGSTFSFTLSKAKNS